MEPNNLEGRSRGSSFRRRALTLVGASALTLSGVGAAVFGAAQAFALTTPNTFNIGTAVSNVAFSSSSTTLSATTVTYTVSFKTTTALPSGDSITITGDPASTQGGSWSLTDSTTTSGSTGPSTTFTTNTGGTVTVATTAAINAGDTISIQIGGNTNPTTATTASVSVSTQTDPGVTTSNSVSFAAAAGPSGSFSTQTPGASSTLTISNVSAQSAVTAGSNSLLLMDSSPYIGAGTATTANETVTLPTNPAQYTVTDTTTGVSAVVTGTVTPNTALYATTPNSVAHIVVFTSPISASANDKLQVVVTGVTNDTNAQQQTLQLLTLGSGTISPNLTAVGTPSTTAPSYVQSTGSGVAAYFEVAAATNPGGSVTSATTVTGTAVTGVSVSLSNSVISTTNVNYTVNFVSTNGGSTLTVTGYTPGATNLLTDNTAGTSQSLSASQVSGTAALTSALVKGHSYTLVSYGVTNASTVGSATLTVSTSGDIIPVSTTFTLTSSATVGPFVSLSTSTPGATANWTINGFKTQSAFTGGSSTITIASTGATFPGAPAQYAITDLTNSSGSGTATSVSGGNSASVTITVPNNIAIGDSLQIVITGVINPSTGGAKTAAVTNSTGTDFIGIPAVSTPAPVTTPPSVATTGSTGGLVNLNGTIYVYAGGVAFGIPTPSVFNTISGSEGNPTVVSATSVTTTGTVAMGTLVQVVGSPQINVVGANNVAYGFSTASQFLSDGYSFSDVTMIPNMGVLTAGSGTPPNAAASGSNGALVNVSGTIYVYSGGVAFGIPTPAVFNTISAAEGNPTVVSATSVTTTGTMATGTLYQHVGSPQVNIVGANGVVTGFSTASQFLSDGYSFANVTMIP